MCSPYPCVHSCDVHFAEHLRWMTSVIMSSVRLQSTPLRHRSTKAKASTNCVQNKLISHVPPHQMPCNRTNVLTHFVTEHIACENACMLRSQGLVKMTRHMDPGVRLPYTLMQSIFKSSTLRPSRPTHSAIDCPSVRPSGGQNTFLH